MTSAIAEVSELRLDAHCEAQGIPQSESPIQAVFQPIENLRTGEVVGFEALARLHRNGELLSPAEFLPGLTSSALAALFRTMLGQAMTFRHKIVGGGAGPYVSINVEIPLVLEHGFVDLLHELIDRDTLAQPGALVLELLEGHATTDFVGMSRRLDEVRAIGIRVALDDIGSAYSSLTNLRNLPVDVMKLDQSFARGLNERPHDLHFVHSLQSLARSIGKRLVVEGVETAEIRDALRVLGVEFGQGYGIARPMPEDAAADWLAARGACRGDQDLVPRSLLGAYAGHLRVVETCHTLMSQPLPIAWRDASKDPHACSIGKYFDRQGLHDTVFGKAHKQFHEVMAQYENDPVAWHACAQGFRQALEQELANPIPRYRCEAVMD